jgi:hypothetical protein
MNDDIGAQLATLAREAVPEGTPEVLPTTLVEVVPRAHGGMRRALAFAAAIAMLAGAVGAVIVVRGRSDARTSHQPSVTYTAASYTHIAKAPIAVRAQHATVYTGREVIVWGGTPDYVDGHTPRSTPTRSAPDPKPVNDGAVYDVASNTWRTMAPAPIPGRLAPNAVWTGNEMIVLGGATSGGADNGARADAAAYNPGTNEWRRLPDAPTACLDHALWLGTALVAGGNCESGDGPSTVVRYDPRANIWTTLSELPTAVRSLADVNGRVVAWLVNGDSYVLASGGHTWSRLPDAGLDATYNTFVAPVGGQLAVAAAGVPNAGANRTPIARFDFGTQQWTRQDATGPVMPLLASPPLVVDGDIALWANLSASEMTSTVPAQSTIPGFSWMNLSTGQTGVVAHDRVPLDRWGGSIVALGNHRYFFWGGALLSPNPSDTGDGGIFTVNVP